MLMLLQKPSDETSSDGINAHHGLFDIVGIRAQTCGFYFLTSYLLEKGSCGL